MANWGDFLSAYLRGEWKESAEERSHLFLMCIALRQEHGAPPFNIDDPAFWAELYCLDEEEEQEEELPQPFSPLSREDHQDSIVTTESEESIPTRPLEKKYKCKGCLMSTNSWFVFQRHQFVHLPFHLKVQKKRFTCSWCGYKTNRLHDLKRHRQHCKGSPNGVHLPYVLVCRVCPYEDDNPITMKRHETEAHGLNKERWNLHCPYCTYKTNSKKHFAKHLRQVHAYGASVPCDICGVQCSSYPKLLEHIQKWHVM